MRIISGKHKGRKLNTFDGYDIRPTSDMARESLFNILGDKIYDCRFLDLFAGSGAVGIESISRGASEVVFVDKSIESLNLVKKNLTLIKEDAKVCKANSLAFLKEQTRPFDIIFCDPPYDFEDMKSVFEIVYENKLLQNDGIIIYEHDKKRKPQEFKGFTIQKSKKYGIAVFDFYSLGDNNE